MDEDTRASRPSSPLEEGEISAPLSTPPSSEGEGRRVAQDHYLKLGARLRTLEMRLQRLSARMYQAERRLPGSRGVPRSMIKRVVAKYLNGGFT